MAESEWAPYDLPVTSMDLLDRFGESAEEVNRLLEGYDDGQRCILRIALARAWDGPDKGWNPKRCYMQMTGLICRVPRETAPAKTTSERKPAGLRK